MIVPIKLGNNIVGCLEVANKRGQQEINDNDMSILEDISSEIASGLIAYEMKINIKKEFDLELKHVKGLMNESFNCFLIPMVNEINAIIMNILKAEK